eukprot:2126467-Amphidinium_carterae.1
MSGVSEDGLTVMSADSAHTHKYSSDGAVEQSTKLSQRVRRAISKPRRKSAAAAARRDSDDRRGCAHRRGVSVMLPLGHDKTREELGELQGRLREAESTVVGVTHDATLE